MGMHNPPIPKMGPWKLMDKFGAGVAAIVAKYYMDPGVTEATVQLKKREKDEIRVCEFVPSICGKLKLRLDWGRGGKPLVMGVPVYHCWYDRFQVGMHHQMGDTLVQDCGISREDVVALQYMLEREWTLARTNAELWMEVAQLACFFLGLYSSF
jgi:hypothetical protein